MKYEFNDGRLFLQRSAEEKQPITTRLSKIEGQVRGIRQMIEDNRHCSDELILANAVTAAMREVAILIAGQHLDAGMLHAATHPNDRSLLADLTSVLRAAMRANDGQ